MIDDFFVLATIFFVTWWLSHLAYDYFRQRCRRSFLRGNSSGEWSFSCVSSHLSCCDPFSPPARIVSRSGVPALGKPVHIAPRIVIVSRIYSFYSYAVKVILLRSGSL